MEQHQHYANMSILFNFLNRIGSLGDRRLFDDVIGNVLGIRSGVGTFTRLNDLTSAYLGDGAKVEFISGDRSTGAGMTARAGIGFKRDNSDPQGTDQPQELPIQLDVDFNFAVGASEAEDRIDSVFARPLFIDGNTQSVSIINPVTDVIENENRDIDKIYGADIVIQAGVAGTPPSAPAPPGTFIEADRICDITILTGSGTIDPAEIVDFRERYRLGEGMLAGIASDVDVVPTVEGGTNVQTALEGIVFASGAFPRGHLQGLKILRTSATLLDATPGETRCGTVSDQNLGNFVNTTALFTKGFVDGGWVAGDGNSGVPSALEPLVAVADTWHYFALMGSTGGFDFGYDTDVDAATLIADASVQATITGTIWFRRIKSFVCDDTPEIPDFKTKGDITLLVSPTLDHEDPTGAQRDATTPFDIVLESIPTGIIVEAYFNTENFDMGSDQPSYVYSKDQADDAASATLAPLGNVDGSQANEAFGQNRIFTDTNATIRCNGLDTAHMFRIATTGFMDRRGRDD